MPIERVRMPNGEYGYRWGKHGKVYSDRASAVRQAVAAYASGYREKKSAADPSLVLKFNPYHDPKNGRFTTASLGGGVQTDDIEVAARLLGEGKKVVLRQPRQLSTLLDRLNTLVKDAVSKGERAPNYDLCNVSVKGTNLFCQDSKGIPRIKMPQLSGKPEPGSKADGLPRTSKGNVDVAEKFREHLESKGIKVENTEENASFLRASQSELNGAKVADMYNYVQSADFDGERAKRLFVSSDNYIVDGHHRWAALVAVDMKDNRAGDIKMPIVRVNMSITELLAEADKFTSDWGLKKERAHKGLTPHARGL